MTIETIKSSGGQDAREDSSKNPLEDMPSFEEYVSQIESAGNSEIPKEINQRSFYESDNIPQNTNGDLILDPKASLLPNEGPYSQIIENEIITTPKDAAFLSSSEKIKLSNNHELSSELLKRCLSVDAYYYSATKHMHEDDPLRDVLRVSLLFYMSDEDIKRGMADIYGVESINSKSDLVRGLIALEESGQLGELSDTEKERLDEFKELTATRAFAEKMHDTTYETEVDGKSVTLPVDNIITFLNLSPDDLKRICTTDPDGKIGQLSKPEFAYAASEYLKKNKVTENYVLPDNIEKRIGFLTSGQYIDFSAVNKLMETKDTLYEKVELNPDLHDAIIEKMPEGISRLEKAAYIYAKMCTILTYDNRFMAANQKGEAAEKHKSLDYVSQISPENNEVVCFEFNMIYAKMLDEQGLHFKSEYKDMIGEDYGRWAC